MPKDREHETTAPNTQPISVEPPPAPIAVTVTTVDAKPPPPHVEHHEHEASPAARENAHREQEPAHEHAAKVDAPKVDATTEPERATTKRVRVIGREEGWPFTLQITEDVVVEPSHVKFELGADDAETWPFRFPAFSTSLAGADAWPFRFNANVAGAVDEDVY
ncbi:MAG: hypothetical protein U0441_39015 [Polyangiaceae bacterium]